MAIEIKASVLYKTLKEFGRLPSTFKIEFITIKTDFVTGKQSKERVSTKHALVRVFCDGNAATVDFEKLKSFVKTMKDNLLSVSIDRVSSLRLSYRNGGFVLCNIEATSSAMVDLDSMSVVMQA